MTTLCFTNMNCLRFMLSNESQLVLNHMFSLKHLETAFDRDRTEKRGYQLGRSCAIDDPKITRQCYWALMKRFPLDFLFLYYSQAQCYFFDRLIHELHLDSFAVSESVYQLGIIHFRYAQYGLKPHFLDLWRQHFETVSIFSL